MNRLLNNAVSAGMLALSALATVDAQTYKKNQPTALALKPGTLENADNADQIKHGAYLARAGDCTACHTQPQERPYGGGLAFKTPFGTLYSTNISSDKQQGIGSWSEKDFAHALRQGVDKEGAHLYPAMPYTAYTKLSDKDVAALWAYFSHVEPVATKNRENELTWPFSWRGGLWLWNLAFFDASRFQRDDSQTDAWNRGAYMVHGLGHCGGCHTPRNFAMAKKSDQSLTGTMTEGWHAPSLLSGTGQSMDRWSADQIAEYLRTGDSPYFMSAGPMNEAIHNSLQYLDKKDLYAIAAYLKSLRLEDGEVTIVRDSGGDKAGGDTSSATTDAHKSSSGQQSASANQGIARKVHVRPIGEPAAKIGNDDGSLSPGERLYMNNCMACHLSGQGMEGSFPALVGNGMVRDKDPTNLLNIILHGARNVQTRQNPTVLTMPNFDWRLNNKQVATLAAYVRNTFGGMNANAATIKPDTVDGLRHDTGTGEAAGGH